MKTAARDVVRGLFAAVCTLLFTGTATAALRPVGELTLQYQKSAERRTTDGGHLLAHCKYLGSGDGTGTGALAGQIAWDLYEDQSRDDMHPTQFRGFVERDGNRHPFHVIGIFIPDPAQPVERWQFAGTIVFDDAHPLGVRAAAITGSVQAGVWKHHYTIWLDQIDAR